MDQLGATHKQMKVDDAVTLPVTEYRPMSRRQRGELQGYVATSTAVGRAVMFLFGLGLVGLVSWSFGRQVQAIRSGGWWLLPPVLLGVWLFRNSKKWTGGSEFRNRVREDLSGGVTAVRRVSAIDAIEVEEAEDEGPAYFILTRDGRTLYVAFQELDRYKSRGFPWTEFEFIEAPNSGRFFSIKKLGDRLRPSKVLPSLSWDELKQINAFDKHYQLLEVDFAKLKETSSLAAG